MVPITRTRGVGAPILATVLALAPIACGQPNVTGSPITSVAPSPAASAAASPVASPGPSGPASSAPPPVGAFDPANVAVKLEPFVDGLDEPLAIANAGDGSGRLFVAQQGGAIRIIDDGRLIEKPFVDLAAEISSGGERGLLGIAFHPDYPTDPRVFVDYTDRDGNTVVSSLTVDPANPDRLDPATEVPILHVEQPFPNHNGGALAFTPDGFLLISLGDGGSGGDPLGNGQSDTTLLGKILRIDIRKPTPGKPYAIPADNPFADGADGRRPEIWLTGLRNPWRISFDRATGDLWIGDVGQGDWEEIDVQRAGAPGGTNYGWNRMEGRHCFSPSEGCALPGLTLPVTDYGHDQGCTVIGGYVERATTPSALTGGYLFGDYCSGRLWAIDPANDTPRDPVVVGESHRQLSAFGEDESGALYAADISGGAILAVVANAR
ncbi:MAG TPA: PQQ-dependent sugar dehydrogenase [Candidatus Limnocylindrales bacterium]|nr:PQQ-dependent sugar dehydrogenase [Candidatus Limnocylindrales bacterium]